VVDILTLDQFVFRYKFSGLGATAVADMERAQRITRSVGDHEQIGLAEFHIGLIYLYWGQFLGAIKYFDDALRHWRFAKQDPAVSLAQLAQGVCHHHAYHYENALANYGKVQRTLAKIEGNGVAPPAVFLTELKSALQSCRSDVVMKIHTLGEGEPPVFRVRIPKAETPDAEDASDQPTRETAVPAPDAPSAPPPSTTPSPSVPAPISNLPSPSTPQPPPAVPSDPEIVGEEPETAVLALPPILQKSPIPHHTNQSEHLVWYHVAERDEEEFLPTIKTETTLLVDTRIDLYTCEAGDFVIVNQADGKGSIPVQPQQKSEDERFRRISYVGEVDPQTETPFSRNVETGEIKLHVKLTAEPAESPIYAEDLLGVVIGIWFKLQPAQK
jgi:hypothetical protein